MSTAAAIERHPATAATDDRITGSGVLVVRDMHCGACVARLRRVLEPITRRVDASLTTRTLDLAWSSGQSADSVLAAVRDTGFDADWIDCSEADDPTEQRTAIIRIGVAAILTMQVMMLAVGGYFGGLSAPIDELFRTVQWLLATPVVFYSGMPFLRGGMQALRARQATMDLPVAIAITAAYTASTVNVLRGSGEVYFDSATMFVTLLLVGRWAEGRGRDRAAQRLRALASRRVTTATRLLGDSREAVRVADLVVGDEVEVMPGDEIPADGELTSSHAAVDESLLTGESMPNRRANGDTVFASTTNAGVTALRARITRTGDATRASQIMQTMHRALSARTPVVTLADRIAGHFIVAVLVLATATLAVWSIVDSLEIGFSAALAVLVASCPCALSLSVPAALAGAIGRLADRGVLVARADRLIEAADVDAVLADKTGTLTSARVSRIAMAVANGEDRNELLQIAAGLERGSTHPIASAFADTSAAEIASIEHHADGISGIGPDGRRYRLCPIVEDFGDTTLRDSGSAISLLRDEVPIAAIALGSELRPGAVRLARTLQQRGIALHIASGDAVAAVEAVGHRIGAASAVGRQTPEGKLRALHSLQSAGHRVMTAGDGINDAALLAASDFGVGMGLGTAIAQNAGDCILVDDRLEALADILEEARRTRRRIRQNVVWAIGYNLAAFPLAASGLLAPWLAALGMAGSSALVVANALRGPTGGDHE